MKSKSFVDETFRKWFVDCHVRWRVPRTGSPVLLDVVTSPFPDLGPETSWLKTGGKTEKERNNGILYVNWEDVESDSKHFIELLTWTGRVGVPATLSTYPLIYTLKKLRLIYSSLEILISLINTFCRNFVCIWGCMSLFIKILLGYLPRLSFYRVLHVRLFTQVWCLSPSKTFRQPSLQTSSPLSNKCLHWPWPSSSYVFRSPSHLFRSRFFLFTGIHPELLMLH